MKSAVWSMKSVSWLQGAALFGCSIAMAQTNPVTLQGKVIDQNGAVIPNAAVVVVDDQGKRFSLVSGADGGFSLQDAPGIYRTTVASRGFRTADSPMTYAADATAIITLKVGSGVVVLEEPASSLGGRTPSAGNMQRNNTWEYGVLFQGGVGVTENRNSFRFLLAGAHVGRILTPVHGTGAFRGNFEYAVELFPYWQSFTPVFPRISCPASTGPQGVNPNTCSAPYNVGGTYTGVSVTPIILRWNFTHGTRLMPFVQGAGGLLWTNHKYPAYGNTSPQDVNETGPGSNTSVWNFTPQFGVGAHYFLKPNRSLDFGAHAVHISSASLGDRNPGVNASVQFSAGYTWWK